MTQQKKRIRRRVPTKREKSKHWEIKAKHIGKRHSRDNITREIRSKLQHRIKN